MEVQTKCTYDRATEAAEFIKSKVSFKPQMALILGSGLGDFADTLDGKVAIPYSDIPYFKKSTVQGHKGNLVFGKCKGVEVVAMQGRNHFYEGHKMEEIVFPIRVFKLIGITKIIVTNAAGGVNKMLEAGDLMLIKDHINYLGTILAAGLLQSGQQHAPIKNSMPEITNFNFFPHPSNFRN